MDRERAGDSWSNILQGSTWGCTLPEEEDTGGDRPGHSLSKPWMAPVTELVRGNNSEVENTPLSSICYVRSDYNMMVFRCEELCLSL